MSTTLAETAIADQIRAAFPFSVDKLPLAGPDNMRTPHYGLFRDDTSECVGVACKRTYVPHTVDDVAALAEAAAAAFDDNASVNCLWHGDGHHVTVAPSVEYRREVFGQDVIWPRLIVSASYDGCAFSAHLGFYRDACRNMAMLQSVGRRVSTRIRHTHHLRERLAELRDAFSHLAAGWDGVVQTAQRLNRAEIDLAAFIRTVYPEPDGASRRTRGSYDRRVRRIVTRIMRERMTLGRPADNIGRATAWEAFNGVQGYVQHDMSRHGRPGEFARALLALDDAAVGRAAEHALALAS